MEFTDDPGYLGKLGRFLGGESEILIWSLFGAGIIICSIIYFIIWRRVLPGRNTQQQSVAGMHFTDVERMRKEGLISEEEYRSIKRKVAERTLAQTKAESDVARDRMILEQAAINPDAVRELIDAKKAARKAEQEAAAPRQRPAATEATAGDPLAGLSREPAQGTAPQPSMNNPRVVAEKQRAAADRATGGEGNSELDLLFEKGAISREEYERLKSFFKK